jgi:NADH:ubiquinone oxidoreductase subunit B-like Fe-S oxidoreductase
VVSVGSCSISGGVFQGCYNVGGSTDEVVPVDVFIPGCPPRPEAIVDGIIQLLTHLKEGNPRPARAEQLVEEVPA